MQRSAPNSKPKITEAGAASRQAILNIAAELFAKAGYAETSMRQIADRAGIRQSSLYYHFESKEVLFHEIMMIGVTTTAARTRAEVEALPATASPRAKVEAAIRGHLLSIHSTFYYSATSNKYRSQIPHKVDAPQQPMRDKYTQYWHELLVEAQDQGYLAPDRNISLARSLILSMMNRTVSWYDPSRGSVDELLDTVLLMVRGIWASD